MMMPLLLLLFQILFLARVTSSEHQRVTLGERRGTEARTCPKTQYYLTTVKTGEPEQGLTGNRKLAPGQTARRTV